MSEARSRLTAGLPDLPFRSVLEALLKRLVPFHLDWIQVEVSTRCVGRCVYCPVPRFDHRGRQRLMSMETFERLEPSFGSVDLVFLQGWGEPLLHPRFREMARRANAAGPRVGFTTAGVHLDRAARRALLDSDIDVVAVSLAGARASHDRWRPGSPLETIDRNLRRLRREREAAAGPALHVAYLLLRDNARELEEAVMLASEWGAREIVVSDLALVLDASLQEQSLLARPDAWPRVREAVAAARTRAAAEGIRLHAPVPGDEQWTCGENVLRSCFVAVTGDVSPCVMTSPTLAQLTHWLGGHRHPIRTLTFGSIRDQPLPAIWRSAPARDFRNALRERAWAPPDQRPPPPAPCRHCHKLFESPALPGIAGK